MSSKLVHKFTCRQIQEWNTEQQCILNETDLSSLINDIILSEGTTNLSSQLSAVKKIQTLLTDTFDSFSCTDQVINLLVKIHSHCIPRHPLQRTIASTLTVISEQYPEQVEKSVIDCIVSNMSSDKIEETTLKSVATEHHFVNYIQSLMEYYPPGERCLHVLMPKVLNQLRISLKNHWTQCFNQSEEITDYLLSLTKVLLNVLHHCHSLLLHLLSNDDNAVIVKSSKGISVSVNDIQWPTDITLTTGSSDWLKVQLKNINEIATNILTDGKPLTRDLLMSAAMVTVVTITTLSPNNLDQLLPTVCHDWFMGGAYYKPLPQLCLIHGLLAKLFINNLTSIDIEKTIPLIVWIFPILCDLLEKFTESSDRYIASRTLSMWTSILSSGGDLVSDYYTSPDSTMISRLLKYIWSHWDDPIDGIRQQCKIMFDNLISLYAKLANKDFQYNDYLQSLGTLLLSLPSPTRGKYSLLTTLVPHLNIVNILHNWPTLPQELMSTMGHQSLACRTGELWGVMVCRHYEAINATSVDTWIQTWVTPLVTVLLTGTMLAKEHVKQYCLGSVISACSDSLKIIESVSHDLSPKLSCNYTDVLNIQLICMSYSEFNATTVSDNISVLERAIEHGDDQVVITGLQVICDTKRTTDLPSFSTLPLIIKCLQLHFNSQSPWFRQEFLSSIKKLILRISDGTYRVLKEREKKRLEMSNEIKEMIEKFTDFLTQLIEVCFNSLSHPFDTFQRRFFALSVLNLMSELLVNPPVSKFNFSILTPESLMKGLVYVLWDTFESNRMLTMKLIRTLHKTSQLFDKESLSFLSHECYRLITSPKYTYCSTGYHLIILLLEVEACQLMDTFYKTSGTTARGLPSQLGLIECLMNILANHMIVCRENLLNGSLNAPMYGVIQAMRSVWELGTMSSSNEVIQLMERLIDQCISIGDMVSPVVCNSSPEGYLPDQNQQMKDNDYKNDDDKLCNKTMNNSVCRQGNSQSVLLCCWHCMKEVILLLTSLLSNNGNILPLSKVDLISHLLIQQLTEARHRGAFEMAYVGFSQLCRFMWNSSNISLNTKPEEWINELISSLQSDSLSHLLSITRRSAGLPFYCQAIVNSEPKLRDHKCLKYLMNFLLSIASTHSTVSTNNETNDELVPQPASVHALNIIRALIRDSRLGEVIVPFIATSIKIAVDGFSSKYWPVRNSSTLLLSALISRVFGVKRVQDERSVKNKMTAREFFTRFPSLHEFLFNALQKTLNSINISESHSLFPVLLLLSHLYPSSLDETTSPHSLSCFQPLIIKAGGNPIWKCRVLASHAFLPTLTSTNIHSVLTSILLPNLVMTNQNQIHGILLMISLVFQTIKDSTCFFLSDEQLCDVIAKLASNVQLGRSSNCCPITRALYLNCATLSLHLLPISTNTILKLNIAMTLRELVIECQHDLSHKTQRDPLELELPSEQFCFLTVYNVTFEPQGGNFISPIEIALSTWKYYYSIQPLYQCLYNSIKDKTLNDHQIKSLTIQVISTTENNSSYGYLLLSALANNWNNDTISDSKKDSHSDINWSQFFYTTVCKLSTCSLREDVKVSIIIWCNSVINVFSSHSSIPLLLSTLSSWCDDTSPDLIRKEIATLLGNNWSILSIPTNPKSGSCATDTTSDFHTAGTTKSDLCASLHSGSYIEIYWSMVLRLINDVEESVRIAMCYSLHSLISKACKGRTSVFVFCQQSCIKHLFKSFSLLYEPEFAFSLLLYLFSILENTHSSATTIKHNTISSLLFEEDKSNSFMEPVQLTQYITEILEQLACVLGHTHPLILQMNSKLSCSLLNSHCISLYFR